MREFIKFIREQGIIGLAIGFILGGSVGKVVTSLVADLIQPIIGLLFGSVYGLQAAHLGPVMVGNFLIALIDFSIIAAVVFYLFKGLKLDKLDLPKQPK